jgi:hypothetical protein
MLMRYWWLYQLFLPDQLTELDIHSDSSLKQRFISMSLLSLIKIFRSCNLSQYESGAIYRGFDPRSCQNNNYYIIVAAFPLSTQVTCWWDIDDYISFFYQTNSLSWIFTVIAHWNNGSSPCHSSRTHYSNSVWVDLIP